MLRFLLAMIEDLLVPSARSLHVHRCTCLTYLPVYFDAVHVYIPTRNAFLLGYPTTKTCFFTLLLLYMPIDASVHSRACSFWYFYSDFTFILITVKIYPSTFLHVHKCTRSSVYLFSFFLLFQHNMLNDHSTRLLGYLHTDPLKNKFTCLPSCFFIVKP